MVRRERHPSDGRQLLVNLTDNGARLLAQDRKRFDAWLAARLAELAPDERDILRRAVPILERLA
jgi:DNA-binding MarR family transcriptional regulator